MACERPVYQLHRSRFNLVVLQLGRRCGQCEGCTLAAIGRETTIVHALLAAQAAAGVQFHERCIDADCWGAFLRAFNRARGSEQPAPAIGHWYMRFYRPDGSSYVVTSVPSLGCPMGPADARPEIGECLEHAVRHQDGGNFWSSSRNMAKSQLPEAPKGFEYLGPMDPASDEFCREAAESVGAVVSDLPVKGGQADTVLSKRLYTKPGGWDAASNDLLVNRLLGLPDDFGVCLGGDSRPADVALCGPPDGDGEWGGLPADHPF